MSNKTNTVLYVGVTTNLIKRIGEHKDKLMEGFTKKYNVDKLVYFEIFDDLENAISREKQIKAGPRKRKEGLIIEANPEYNDLYQDIL